MRNMKGKARDRIDRQLNHGLGREMFVVFFLCHKKQDKQRRTKHLKRITRMNEKIEIFFFF